MIPDYRSQERLFEEDVWFEAHTEAMRETLRQQLDYWRTLGYERFRELTTEDRIVGKKPKYHIGELPLDSVFLSFNHLTEIGREVPLKLFIAYLKRQGRRNGIGIAIDQVRVSRKRSDKGVFSLHAYVHFERISGVWCNTFALPDVWGSKCYHMAPVWRRSTALKFVQKESEETMSFPFPAGIDIAHQFHQLAIIGDEHYPPEAEPAELKRQPYRSPRFMLKSEPVRQPTSYFKIQPKVEYSPTYKSQWTGITTDWYTQDGESRTTRYGSTLIRQAQIFNSKVEYNSESEDESDNAIPDEKCTEKAERLLDSFDPSRMSPAQYRKTQKRINNVIRLLLRRACKDDVLMGRLRKLSKDIKAAEARNR